MTDASGPCILCRGREGDAELGVEQVWEDRFWRLTIAREGEIVGFCYLEPKRHIAHVEDLDGEEARSLGSVLARTTRAIREAAEAERVYVYVFGGGVPHLHIHLAPHREGDPLNDRILRGEVTETRLPSGATALTSRDFPVLPRRLHEKVRNRLHRRLASEDLVPSGSTL